MNGPFPRLTVLFLFGIVLAACEEGAPTAAVEPPAAPDLVLAALECRASTVDLTVRCAPGTPELGGDALIVGGQGLYVQLSNTMPTYDGGTGDFEFDVDVQNLIPQALATTDGV